MRTSRILAACTVVVAVLAAACARESGSGGDSVALAIPFGDFVSREMLRLPAVSGPAPVVVLVGGSGPEDMNGDDASVGGASRGHVLADVAESRAGQGFAALRYNKHYVNGIDVDPRFAAELTMARLAEDAREAIRMARADSRIDARRIYLYGWSEGAAVAAAVAAGMPEVRGLVLHGVVGVPWREGLVAQWDRVVRPYLRQFAVDGSVGVDEVRRALRGDGGVVARELLGVLGDFDSDPAVLSPAFDLDGDGRIDLDSELLTAAAYFVDTQLAGGVFRLYGGPTALPDVTTSAAALCAVPVLIQHGENDGNVSIEAATRLDRALTAEGNGDHTLLTYPRSGHSLGKAIDLQHDPIGPIGPTPLADLGRWLRDHAK
ncbi:alpha/beta hydrolase family protein [Nocardia pseudobrasiliensis]|uniref:alpha/beta hydrolase family protein n=1 Tax=Nocardia pseudobrasiliensis TaxID=45979 RepID=UPI0014709CBE|nr:prolyl oligopeptidase family serine peptidase [Nocardia pseudobrasiliensis]